MKYYKTKEFKVLWETWRGILEQSGFNDAELPNNALKVRELRVRNGAALQKFFYKLDHWLASPRGLSDRDFAILTRWSKGIYITVIAKELGCSVSTVSRITRKYKRIVLSWNR